MLPDGFEALLAQIVLEFAGVFPGGLGVHAESDQHRGQELVPLVHAFCDRRSLVRQGDETVAAHGDVAVFTQPLRGVADARLGDAELCGDVDGADIAMLLLHHQHGFQIVFGGFLYFHMGSPPCIKCINSLPAIHEKCKEISQRLFPLREESEESEGEEEGAKKESERRRAKEGEPIFLCHSRGNMVY